MKTTAKVVVAAAAVAAVVAAAVDKALYWLADNSRRGKSSESFTTLLPNNEKSAFIFHNRDGVEEVWMMMTMMIPCLASSGRMTRMTEPNTTCSNNYEGNKNKADN